jgi:hypothetical protein
MARLPNKCLHVMVDGAYCGSPATRHEHFCYHHQRQREQRLKVDADRARTSRNAPYQFPILEDANSIQVSLTQIMCLLADGKIDHKTANLMLYTLQIATANLKKTRLDLVETPAVPSPGPRPRSK